MMENRIRYSPRLDCFILLNDIDISLWDIDSSLEGVGYIFPQDIKLTEKTQPLAIIGDSIKEELEKAKIATLKAKKLAQQLYDNINLLEEDNHERS